MTIHPFPNAKPKILGVDAHEAILLGNLDVLDPVNSLGYATPIGTGGTAQITTAEIVYGGRTLVATKSINKGFIRNTQGVDYPSGNPLIIRIREDDINGNILLTSGVSGGFSLMSLSLIITNQVIGSKTYVFTAQLSSPTFGDFIRLHSDATNLSYIVDIDDTHAAELIGDNTQITHETEVIP